MNCRLLPLWICLLFVSSNISGQEQKTEKDSVKAVYQNIEKLSKRTKFGKWTHSLLFKSLDKNPAKEKSLRNTKDLRFVKNENKVIRKISITTLDPFGHSVTDTLRKPKRFLEKAGNDLHVKTKRFVISDLLLFDVHDKLDSLIILENERLIRSQRYIRSVRIETISTAGSDSIDINIRVLDSWSLIPNLTPTTSKMTYELTERNFLGFGHEWDNTLRQNLKDNRFAFSTDYTVPNIAKTHIRSNISYQKDLDDNYIKGIRFERPFYSIHTRWVGGIMYERRFLRDSISNISGIYALQPFKYNVFDVWLGHSFPLKNTLSPQEKKANMTTNLVTAFRFLNIHFQEKPLKEYDYANFFTDEKFWLGGIGISSRQFVQDKFVFNYDIIEDVPIGKYIGIIQGYQRKNSIGRLYLGAKATYGKYFNWGYFSSNIEFGSFYRDNKTEQNAFATQLNYFTPVFNVGTWRVRQFLKSDLILGNRRADSMGDMISINESNGIPGINDPKLMGTKKLLFSWQTQSYSPWSWAGFRFSPFINYSLAMLGNSSGDFLKSKAFSKITLGVIITNDYLVFNSFQISFSYFPYISNEGNNIIKTNTFRTTDFGYLDFGIGRPETVLYE